MNKENLPTHIAIVPDANRRWAKKHGLLSWQGHLEGAKRCVDNVETALELNIKCLSIWGGSYNNLTKRSKIEIEFLFKIYEQYFKKLIKRQELHQDQIKVSILGRWPELLPKNGIKAAEELINLTKGYNKKFLNILIGYNGTDEMLYAIKGVTKEARKNKNLKINENTLKDHLWSGHLPPVDLLIRTGSQGDPHNSVGFMMWLTANSQYYFTNTFYPDFTKKEFIKAIEEYQRRERRLGK